MIHENTAPRYDFCLPDKSAALPAQDRLVWLAGQPMSAKALAADAYI